MSEFFDPYAGTWVRFDRYEVRGDHIRPAPGARATLYDPWQEFHAGRRSSARRGGARSKQWTEDPPYRSLVDLAEHFSVERLVRWCSRYGLLGVLLAQTDMVTLVPMEEESGRLGQIRYFRMNARWGKFVRREVEGASPDWLRPGALVQHLRTTKWLHEQMGETWARFFPSVPQEAVETFRYPRPLSKPFWESYAEPVEEFAKAAIMLRDALDGLDHDDPHSADLLNALVFRATPAIAPEPGGGWRQCWVGGSLLGSLAMMALVDLAEQRRLLRCAVCQTPFVTTSPKGLYCSKKCRNTAQKRTQRAKIKETPNG